jgi:hypothetical protein
VAADTTPLAAFNKPVNEVASVVVPVAVNAANVPAEAAVPPIAPGLANVAPLRLDAFKFATLVVDATVNGAVPVVAVDVTVVKRPVDAVVAPIEVLLIVDAVVGLIVNAPAGLIATVPVPDGLIATAKLAGLKVTAPVAVSVVNAPVEAVVAPTVPLMFIEAVPVRLVTVPELGVPNAPPLVNGVVPFDAAVMRPCASTVIDA